MIAALQSENDIKDSEIKKLQDNIEEVQTTFIKKELEIKEQQDLKLEGNCFLLTFAEMTAILNEKDAAFKVVQQELAVIKDFRVIFDKEGITM